MPTPRITVWVQKFPDRKFLVLQWHDPETGKRKSRSAETADPKEADQKARDLEYELTHETYQEPTKLDWSRFRELFEAEYLPGLRPRSQEKLRTVLDVFEQVVNPAKLRSVTERTVSAFVKGLRERKRPGGKTGLAPITVKNYLIGLKTALNWAVEQKLLPAVPTFPTVKVPKKKPQPIPVESFERLLEKAPDERWKAYLLCGWWAGLRLSEALHLRWSVSADKPWVDLDRNRIVLPAAFAKADVDQSVPLHPVLRAALAKLDRDGDKVFGFIGRFGQPLTRTDVCYRVQKMARAAGVRLTMHQLRKGFGCRVAKQLGKGGAAMLHELMRHSSMQITMDYYANVDDALQDAINQLT
jgi:integrase